MIEIACFPIQKEETNMYGDNKVNQEKVNLFDVARRIERMNNLLHTFESININQDEILILAQSSQMITDDLNRLYEQMKGN
jgi:hypothetical protein